MSRMKVKKQENRTSLKFCDFYRAILRWCLSTFVTEYVKYEMKSLIATVDAKFQLVTGFDFDMMIANISRL